MDKFDLIVIGGGPGGYVAAERAAEGGLKVCLFEKNELGGVCLNEGCVPTKTLLHSAKVLNYAQHGETYGVKAENVSIDHAAVIERKKKVVKTLVSGVAAKMKAGKIKVVKEAATIREKTAEGIVVEAAGTAYCGEKLIIATGSVATIPPVPGVKEGLASGFVVTNKEILDVTTLPNTLVVIGGGVIGLEMACYFATVGVKVIIIEMMNKIAGTTDPEICNNLMKHYEKMGMEFKLSCKVTSVGTDCVNYEENGEAKSVKADMVLMSVGRRANTAGVGLENIGVYTERGAIVTDEKLCTNVPNVYAVGDVNGKIMLAHTAYREAEVCVNNMLGKKDAMRYNVIPSVIYTNPEVATIGESEQSAKEKGMNVKTIKLPTVYSGRYVAEVNGDDFIKMIVDTDTNRVVGCHMVGTYSSEMIFGVAMMVDTELSIERLKKIVFPHPTVSEIIKEALFHA